MSKKFLVHHPDPVTKYDLRLSFHEPDHRYMSVKNHILSGVTLWKLINIIIIWRNDIDWKWYTHRILFLLMMSIINSIVALWETFMYNAQVDAIELTDHDEMLPPIFILGHPRTGTTHLHNLLSQDGRFIFATTFDVGFPSGCITLDTDVVKDTLKPILDKKRPMDNMHQDLDWDLPQEDELATNQMTGGLSPYMSIVFIKSKAKVDKLYTLNECDPREKNEWMKAFITFCKKITLKWKIRNGGRLERNGVKPRLLIKSPVHTARIPLLLSLFPGAKFIYIHRHPVEVIQSAAHMANTYYWYSCLQRPSDEATETFIMDQFVLLTEQYLQDRSLIPEGSLMEVEFAKLDRNPVSTVNKIYDYFQLRDFKTRMEPRLREYISANNLTKFKKNCHTPLDVKAVEAICRACPEAFRNFNYK